MSFEQRTTPEPDHLEPTAPWLPDRLTDVQDRGSIPRRPPDRYVVIDELDELGCRLAVDPWPAVDADGRLVFDDRGSQLVSVPPRVLHGLLSAARARTGDEAPDRELRIGDVFGVWLGPSARELLGVPPQPRHERSPEGHRPDAVELVDVTRDARVITNAAAQAAAGDVLTDADAATFAVGASPPDGPGGRHR